MRSAGRDTKRHRKRKTRPNRMDALKVAKAAFRDTRMTAFTLGVGTVAATHAVMLFDTSTKPSSSRMNHALINLAAAGSIVWGSRILG